MQNAALYIRVSTDDQLEFSPDAQRHALMEYAKRNDMIVSPEHIFVDEGISGTTAKKRHAFQQMIATARSKLHPIDVILVHKFDRFARSREDSVVYKSLLKRECNIKVISITEQLEDDKFSVILEAMLEAMAEYYSLNLSDEVKKGMTEKAKRGGFQASSPYGYNAKEKKGNLEIIEDEAKLVKLIFNKFVYGNMTYSEITNFINELGYKTRKGNAWERRTVRYMLENPIYVGNTRWNYRNKRTKVNPEEEWIIAKGIHEPLVDQETFDIAQKKIKQISLLYTHSAKPSSTYKHWLSGSLRCNTCKGSMTFASYPKNKRTDNAPGYYLCNRHRKGSCSTSNTISIYKLTRYILDAIENDLRQFKEMSIVPITIKRTESEIELETLNRQLGKIQRKYDMAKEAYLAEIDSIKEYKENKIRIQQEETELQRKIDNLSKTTPTKKQSDDFIKTMSNTLNILKDDQIDMITKNKALKSIIQAIYVDVKNDSLEIEYYIAE